MPSSSLRHPALAVPAFALAGLLLTPTAVSGVVIVPFGDCGWTLTDTHNTGSYVTPDACAPLRGPLCPGPNGTPIRVDETTGAVRVVLSRHIYNAGTEIIYAHYTLHGMWAVSVGGGSGGTLDNSCPGNPALSTNTIDGYFPLAPGDNVFWADETMLPFHPGLGSAFGGYLDVQITTDVPLPVGVYGSSWGNLKILYR